VNTSKAWEKNVINHGFTKECPQKIKGSRLNFCGCKINECEILVENLETNITILRT
jgi:hypothetical protein